jgi:hypothetical protein
MMPEGRPRVAVAAEDGMGQTHIDPIIACQGDAGAGPTGCVMLKAAGGGFTVRRRCDSCPGDSPPRPEAPYSHEHRTVPDRPGADVETTAANACRFSAEPRREGAGVEMSSMRATLTLSRIRIGAIDRKYRLLESG